MTRTVYSTMLSAAAIVGLCAFMAPPADTTPKAEFKGDPYTLGTCIVSGEKLGSMGEPVVKDYDGREIRFCCKTCVKEFEGNKDAMLKKIDEQLIKQQMNHYPLQTCVVQSEDKLEKSAQGDPVNLIYKNRLVRFCCKGCVKDFNADPAAYIKKLDDAVVKQQQDKYPLETCVVGGEKLGSMGEPVNYVVGTTLVRFCCKNCVGTFNKDPQKYLAMVSEGWKAKHTGEHDHAEKHDDHEHDHDHAPAPGTGGKGGAGGAGGGAKGGQGGAGGHGG